MKIEDDFLEQKDFIELQALIMGDNISWYFNDGIDFGYRDSDGVVTFPEKVDKNKFQFTHLFYKNYVPVSSSLKILNPLLNKIEPISLIRIKANLLTKTPEIVENEFHVDISYMSSEEKLKQWTTSIFYVNTNNEYTKFEDGTKVESVANRMITFPANMIHTGTSCTDENIRVIINFDYYARE